jgi:hypothetical protein
MKTRNFTMALPEEILKDVKLLAVKQNTSVTKLMIQAMEKLLAEHNEYEQAKESALRLLQQGFNLNTNGNIPWSRDELHERRY